MAYLHPWIPLNKGMIPFHNKVVKITLLTFDNDGYFPPFVAVFLVLMESLINLGFLKKYTGKKKWLHKYWLLFMWITVIQESRNWWERSQLVNWRSAECVCAVKDKSERMLEDGWEKVTEPHTFGQIRREDTEINLSGAGHPHTHLLTREASMIPMTTVKVCLRPKVNLYRTINSHLYTSCLFSVFFFWSVFDPG